MESHLNSPSLMSEGISVNVRQSFWLPTFPFKPEYLFSQPRPAWQRQVTFVHTPSPPSPKVCRLEEFSSVDSQQIFFIITILRNFLFFWVEFIRANSNEEFDQRTPAGTSRVYE